MIATYCSMYLLLQKLFQEIQNIIFFWIDGCSVTNIRKNSTCKFVVICPNEMRKLEICVISAYKYH